MILELLLLSLYPLARYTHPTYIYYFASTLLVQPALRRYLSAGLTLYMTLSPAGQAFWEAITMTEGGEVSWVGLDG